MRLALFVAATLLACLMLAFPAQAADPPYAKVDHYRFVISGYSDKLIFESEMQVIDGYTASSISDNKDDPNRLFEAIFIQTPHTSLTDAEKSIAESLQGHKQVFFRSASVHGVHFYVYCPDAWWINFKLYITPAYETTERYLGTVTIDP
jgi:hypothetical protein